MVSNTHHGKLLKLVVEHVGLVMIKVDLVAVTSAVAATVRCQLDGEKNKKRFSVVRSLHSNDFCSSNYPVLTVCRG